MFSNSPNKYLFTTFLKIGSTAFGGFVALVSVIRDQIVDKDQQLEDDTILDGLSLAAVLPGPLAVNVVSFIGYKINNISGALISMFAVLLPSFIGIYLLSIAYFEWGDLPIIDRIFSGITPAVAAIVFAVAFGMYQKNIKELSQTIILVGSAAILFIVGGFLTTLIILMISGLLGYFLFKKKFDYETGDKSEVIWGELMKAVLPIFIAVLVLLLLPFFQPFLEGSPIGQLVNISAVFGGLSLTLFGGGYVMIPAMNELLVEKLQWVTVQEFSDGIALGQITPGPILITAAFIGYKLSGFWGALVATISIFLPPGLLMILATQFLSMVKNSPVVKAVFYGLRPAIIGMILSAGVILVQGMNQGWISYLLLSIVIFLLLKFKIGAIYLIPLSGLAGYLLFG